VLALVFIPLAFYRVRYKVSAPVLLAEQRTDTRRMNVALTRAKSSLFILGNSATLERSDDNWRAIVDDARQRSFLLDVSLILLSRRSPV
jgi:hypothetical protein